MSIYCKYTCAFKGTGKCPHKKCHYLHKQRKCDSCKLREVAFDEKFCIPCTAEYNIVEQGLWPCEYPNCHHFAGIDKSTGELFRFCSTCSRAYSEAKANGETYSGPESMPDEHFDVFRMFGCITDVTEDGFVKQPADAYNEETVQAAIAHYRSLSKKNDDETLLRQAVTPPSAPSSRATSMNTLPEAKTTASHAAATRTLAILDDVKLMGLVAEYAEQQQQQPATIVTGVSQQPAPSLSAETKTSSMAAVAEEHSFEGDDDLASSVSSDDDDADAVPAVSTPPSSPIKCALSSKITTHEHGAVQGTMCLACQAVILGQLMASGAFKL